MSQAFKDYVSRSTFKGVERVNGTFQIVRGDLSDARLRALIEKGQNTFGYPSKDAARSAVISAFQDTSALGSGLSNTTSARLPLLPPGSILSFTHDDGHEMRLIATGDNTLLVLSDKENVLHTGDTLNCLSLSICQGENVVFQVVRNGEQYPSPDKYLILKDIGSLSVHKNDGYNLLDQSALAEQPPIPGLTSIYALEPTGDGNFFTPDTLTQDPAVGLYKIDFNEDGSITYAFNPDYRFNAADDANFRDGLINATPGTLAPVPMPGGGQMLQIRTKARIGKKEEL